MKSEKQGQPHLALSFITTFFKGSLIGIANSIPGVSGGTVAVLLHVYQVLIEAFGLHWKKIKQNLPILIPLLFGMVAGVFGFSNLLTFLFAEYSMPTYFAFIGLILGSVPFILRAGEIKKANFSITISFLSSLALILILNLIAPPQNVIHTTLTLPLFFLLLVISIIAAIAMIVPGISGSFMLLVFGFYETVINAVSTLNFLILIPVGIGVLIGIVIGSRLIAYFLTHYRKLTYACILGLLVGSVFVLFPGFSFNLQGLISIVTLTGGFFLAYYFSRNLTE